VLQRSDDGGATFAPLSSEPISFENQTLQHARALMPQYARLFRSIGSDLNDCKYSISATNAVIDIGTDGAGGVYTLSNGGKIGLNPVTPLATTYNPVLGSVDALARPWMLRARHKIIGTAFTAATFHTLLSLDGSGVGGGGGGHAIQVMSTGTSSATQVYLWLFNAAIPGGQQFSMGTDFVLGGPNGIPINQFFYVTLYFDMVSLRWELNDVPNSTNVLSVPNLDAFPSDATSVNTQTTDTVVNGRVDALACAYAMSIT
jgi:hypothetical protein